ncbi:MAG: hypothetical protein QM669_04835 [Siphonobacter sp.]
MKRSLLFLSLSVVLLFGCKKDDDNGSTTTDNKTTLINNWQAQTVTAVNVTTAIPSLTLYTKGGSSNLIDFSKFYVNFKSDGSYEQSDNDGTVSTGIWSLGTDDKTITMTTSGGTTVTYVADPISSTSTTFKYTINTTNPTTIDTQIIAAAAALGVTVSSGAYLTFVAVPE